MFIDFYFKYIFFVGNTFDDADDLDEYNDNDNEENTIDNNDNGNNNKYQTFIDHSITDDEDFVKKYNDLAREQEVLRKKYDKLISAYKNLRENSLRECFYGN